MPEGDEDVGGVLMAERRTVGLGFTPQVRHGGIGDPAPKFEGTGFVKEHMGHIHCRFVLLRAVSSGVDDLGGV